MDAFNIWVWFSRACIFAAVTLTVMKVLDIGGLGWNAVILPAALWGVWTALCLVWILVPIMWRRMKRALYKDWNP